MSLTIESVGLLNVYDLVCNIWVCKDHIKNCTKDNRGHCRIEIFCGFCVESLKTKWKPEWGVFDEIMVKISENEKSFADDLKHSFVDKQLVVHFLKDYEECLKIGSN